MNTVTKENSFQKTNDLTKEIKINKCIKVTKDKFMQLQKNNIKTQKIKHYIKNSCFQEFFFTLVNIYELSIIKEG